MARLFFRLVRFGLLVGLVAAATAVGWAWWALHQPYRGWQGEQQIVEIRSGQGAGAILRDLTAAGVLADSRLARAYLVYYLGDPPLRAGEYRFDEPLSTPQVLGKLIRGEIVTYPVTLIEGLTLDESAEALAAQGFGDAGKLRREMREAALVADLDPAAKNLEGYLYPDTYHLARGITEAEIVATLVRTFRERYSEAVGPRGPARPLRELVTLASIVEKEALRDEERPLIAGVYANRLRRGIALYADPTVIYALKLLGTWDGNLRRADLALDSPYNTYVYPGLPPGPICSPSAKSLAAAAAPAETPYLYFVSKNDGSHVFAETYAEHRKNVDYWQKRYWRKRWAEEGSR